MHLPAMPLRPTTTKEIAFGSLPYAQAEVIKRKIGEKLAEKGIQVQGIEISDMRGRVSIDIPLFPEQDEDAVSRQIYAALKELPEVREDSQGILNYINYPIGTYIPIA